MNLTQCSDALKNIYLPAFENQIAVEPAAFLQKIKKIPLIGDDIVSSAPVGLNGGFGFGKEGTATPNAGSRKYMKFHTNSKDMFCNIEISDKTIKLASSNKNSMINILEDEVKGSYETAKWNLGRALFGNGTGILANVDVLATAGNVISVDSIKSLKEGLVIDFYATGAEVDTTPAVAARQVVAINRVPSSGKYAVTIDGAATTLSAGFITVQNSYGREITGLNSIFDDTIDTLYDIAKASYPIIKPIVKDAAADISDSTITSALRESQNVKGGNVDMIFAGNVAFDAYVEYLRSNNQRIEQNLELKGGFSGITFVYGKNKAIIINEDFVPDAEMWGIDSSCFELHQKDWAFAEYGDSGVFNLVNGTSNYRALLANYGDLICKNPGSCVRIHNIA